MVKVMGNLIRAMAKKARRDPRVPEWHGLQRSIMGDNVISYACDFKWANVLWKIVASSTYVHIQPKMGMHAAKTTGLFNTSPPLTDSHIQQTFHLELIFFLTMQQFQIYQFLRIYNSRLSFPLRRQFHQHCKPVQVMFHPV